jgi:hypothetical protein
MHPSGSGVGLGTRRIDRRQLIGRGTAAVAAAGALPALVAACGDDEDEDASKAKRRTAAAEGDPIVGDVLDFALS